MPTSFNLKSLIVHEIEKKQDSYDADLIESTDVMDIDENAEKLLDEIEKKFSKSPSRKGKFFENDDNPFPIKFREFLANKTTPALIKFSQDTTKELQKNIKNIFKATGGYIVYAQYYNNENIFYVLILRNVSTLYFQRSEGKFKVASNFTLNTSELAMACRIELDKMESTSERYISFISKQSDKNISEYFINWISVKDDINAKTDTKLLLDIIKEIPKPVNPQTNKEFEQGEFNSMVFDYINKDLHNKVDLHQLGLRFYQDEDAFTKIAREKEYGITTVFVPDKSRLKNLIKISFTSTDNFEVSFPPGYLKSGKVDFNIKQKFVILKSPDLYEKLQAKLADEPDNS